MRPSHPLSKCVYVCVSMYRYERPVRRSVRPARPVRPERAVPVPVLQRPRQLPDTRRACRRVPCYQAQDTRRGAVARATVTKHAALPTAPTPGGVSSTPASDVTPYDVPVSPNQCSDCRSEHSARPSDVAALPVPCRCRAASVRVVS